jgi:hypothetical protein
MAIAAAAAAVFISGCAGDKEFLKAQAEAAIAAGNARVAEAQAAAEEARAVQALAGKLDATGASNYLLAKAIKGLPGAQASTQVSAAIQRPPGFLEAFQEARSWIRDVGGLAVPWMQIRETSRTARAGYDRDVRLEEVRQGGESSRIQSVSQIAREVASGQRPNVTINTNTFGGDGVIGGGNQANNRSTNNTTTTTNCNGGSGAPGGGAGTGPTAGPGGAGGNAPGGNC